jgi:prepilin-type N-terminal cleavage/methylation domain-containing protein
VTASFRWSNLRRLVTTRIPCKHPGRREFRLGRSAPAFTLIELILAIALLGVLMALVYSAMFQVTGGGQALMQELSEDQELRLLLRMITQDLQSMRFLDNFTTPRGTSTLRRPSGLLARTIRFRGSDFSQVSFHAATRSRQYRQRPEEGDPLLHEVGYSVVEDVSAGTLSLQRREDYYLDDDIEHGGVTAMLAGNIEAFKVECLLPPTAPGQTQEVWTMDWDSMQQSKDSPLPIAVRVTLGQLGKSGRHLKETLVVNLRLLPPDSGTSTTPTPTAKPPGSS